MKIRESEFKPKNPTYEEVFEQIKDLKQPDGTLVYGVPIRSNKEYWDEETGRWIPCFDAYQYKVVNNYPVL